MRRVTLAAGLVALPGFAAPTRGNEAEGNAVAAIGKLDGVVHRDDSKPGTRGA